jgi:hypothetical protein
MVLINMLVSMKILLQHRSRTTGWWVVSISNKESGTTDVATFFRRVIQHEYDPLEPFQLIEMLLYEQRLGLLRRTTLRTSR